MKKQFRQCAGFGLAVLMLMATLSGCGAAQTPPSSAAQSDSAQRDLTQSDPTQSDPVQDSSAPSAGGQAVFPLEVTDHLGRVVSIEAEPQKLVSGYYITTSLLIALGQSDKLVGVEAKAERFPVYGMAAPRILDLPNVGSAKEFDLEGCAALAPDLVILPIRLADAITTLEGLGITAIGVDPEDKQRLLETIELLGAATGGAEKAERLAAYIRAKYTELETLTQGLQAPRLYFAGNSSYLSTAGKSMYQNSLIEAAGAENVAGGIEDSYWAEVSYEQLIAWAPDVIVVAPGAEYPVEELKGDAALAGLEALHENRVYQMPSQVELWDAPVASSILGSLWLASVLHPEVYSEADFSADFSAFYSTFYGIDVQLDAQA